MNTWSRSEKNAVNGGLREVRTYLFLVNSRGSFFLPLFMRY